MSHHRVDLPKAGVGEPVATPTVRTFRRPLGATLAVAVILMGCSSDSSDTEPEPTSDAGTVASDVDDPTEPTADGSETDSTSADDDATAVGLAALISASRFAEAVELTAPTSAAATYLSYLSLALERASALPLDGDETSPTTVCIQSVGSQACSAITIDAVDDDGLVTTFSLDGTPVTDLYATGGSDSADGFILAVTETLVWPDLLTFTSWTLTNDTSSDVVVDDVSVIAADGASVPAEEPNVIDDLDSGGAVVQVSSFPGDHLDGSLAVHGTGGATVAEFDLVAPLGDAAALDESSVDRDASSTDFETPGGTTVTIPGTWDPYEASDDESADLAEARAAFGKETAVARQDTVLFAFSPEESPLDLSPEELQDVVESAFSMTEVEAAPLTTDDGQPTTVIGGTVEFGGEASGSVIVPAADDLFVMILPLFSGDAENLAAVLDALTEHAGIAPTP